jgi:50S ribosomal protein L16 3-hydroxylase
MLFADGVCFDCVGGTAALAQSVCAQDSVILDAALASAPAVVDLLTQLCNMGCIAFESEE